jgi:hypothetical protein
VKDFYRRKSCPKSPLFLIATSKVKATMIFPYLEKINEVVDGFDLFKSNKETCDQLLSALKEVFKGLPGDIVQIVQGGYTADSRELDYL